MNRTLRTNTTQIQLMSSGHHLDDDDDVVTALLMMYQSMQEAARTTSLTDYSLSLHAARKIHDDDKSSSSNEDVEGPGRGNTNDRLPKAKYAKRVYQNIYHIIRNLDPDIQLFEKTVHMSREDFDSLYDLVKANIEAAMDVRHSFTEQENAARTPKRRRLCTEELLFLFLDLMGGSNEGGEGVERAALRYGIATGTISNYFRHVLFAVYNSLDGIQPKLIRWPNEEERTNMEGLIIGFPSCVFFVDGNKSRRWRPGHAHEQKRAYDGYKHMHAYAITVFCDIFGRFIRVEITDKGAENDRTMYTNSDVYINAEAYLSNGQHGMADMGYAGGGNLVVPFKVNESTEWMYKSEHNRDIRRQRMVNEWGIGYLNNRHRILLGRWPFERDFFPITYTLLAMLANWRFDRRGFCLQTRERYEEKLVQQEQSSSLSH